MTNELFCRCGHSEYLHVENHPKGWALASYPCSDTSKPGACPCLDFQLKPRPRPSPDMVHCHVSPGCSAYNCDCPCRGCIASR